MENKATKLIEMTLMELEELEAFRVSKQKEQKEQMQRQEREAYKELIDETINTVFPELIAISEQLHSKKKEVYTAFQKALVIKGDIFGVKSDQKTHTFTNKKSTQRITLGCYETDGYADTVNEGVAKVRDFISSLAKDQESKLLVDAIMRLLNRDKDGNLKVSRVMQLQKMANESQSEEFADGVRIIQEAYQPTISKYFIRASKKNDQGAWADVPLGITEA